MKHSPTRVDGVLIGILILALPAVVFALSISHTGERTLGVVETIQGIPYPTSNGAAVIVEEMAHADLFLQESVFAKQARITVSFDPQDVSHIDLGIRENEFWLSYVKYPLYQQGIDVPGFQTKEISIPLSTAIQDTNRSVDLMFFTEAPKNAMEWRIHAFRASVQTYMPSLQEIKSYAKSVITRERPL